MNERFKMAGEGARLEHARRFLAVAAVLVSTGVAWAGPVGAPADANAMVQPVALKPTLAAPQMSTNAITFEPTSFSELPGWDSDNHLAAWKAFLASCRPVLDAIRAGPKAGAAQPPPLALLDACELALRTARDHPQQTRAGAKSFFESNFKPHSVFHAGASGLLTGYYEPLVKGSRVADDVYQTPVYRRPPDLVNVVAESERGATSHRFTHMRKTASGLAPYLTRAEIEQGALKGQNLELLYFKDPVDVFFMQIQGSARVELPSGEQIRITYDGKNGYPYTSIGRHLIEAQAIKPDDMSLKSLTAWLKADRKRAEPVMWANQSYVFFRELKGAEASGPMGALSIQLQVGRSLAVDTAFHALGTPIFVSSPGLTHANRGGDAREGFNRLMIAQDVGSAIKGPERGDIYFGSGDQAGRLAGVTKHQGRFFVLLPGEAALAEAASGGPP
ncbi:MAG: murein transglycosylase A [Hyphomicrobium sp.]